MSGVGVQRDAAPNPTDRREARGRGGDLTLDSGQGATPVTSQRCETSERERPVSFAHVKGAIRVLQQQHRQNRRLGADPDRICGRDHQGNGSAVRRAPALPPRDDGAPASSGCRSSRFSPRATGSQGDTGLKQTTSAAWEGIFLNAEELASITPIPEAVLNECLVRRVGGGAGGGRPSIAQKIDAAVFSGLEKPATWPPDLISGGDCRWERHHGGFDCRRGWDGE